MKETKVIARIILEVLGSPKEHVETAIKEVIKQLEADKNLRMIHQTTYETEQQEATKLWSTFSEVELQAESARKLMEICFDYMPSSIEIIEPAGIEIDTGDLSNFLNDLLSRLHRYDMTLKNMHAENVIIKHDLNIIKEAAKKAIEAKLAKDKAAKEKPQKKN